MIQEMQGKIEDTELEKTNFSDHIKKLERDHSSLSRRIEELEVDNEKLSMAVEELRKRQNHPIRYSKDKGSKKVSHLRLRCLLLSRRGNEAV